MIREESRGISSDSDDNERTLERKPLIHSPVQQKLSQPISPKRFLFSSFANSAISPTVTCSWNQECYHTQVPRSLSDNIAKKTFSPSISKKNIIKSTTVTERLSEFKSTELPPSAFIVTEASNENRKILKIKHQRPSDISLEKPTTPKDAMIFTETGTPIDSSVQSGVLMRGKGQIHETYL